jgi:hypothetical protein
VIGRRGTWAASGQSFKEAGDKSESVAIAETRFAMIIKWIDLALSRLKQGFDSPRERQQQQKL